ncbi:MAG: hypothetical protein ACK55I_23900, partial [bacterium]
QNIRALWPRPTIYYNSCELPAMVTSLTAHRRLLTIILPIAHQQHVSCDSITTSDRVTKAVWTLTAR